MLTPQQKYRIRTQGIPLTGADHFHMTLERESRRFFDASHRAQLILRMGPGFEQGLFREVAQKLYRNIPFLHASIRPRWGGLFGPSVYHASGSPRTAPIHEHKIKVPGRDTTSRGVPQTIRNLLNAGPLDLQHDPLIRFDLIGSGDETLLVITWLFLLFDGQGMINFTRLLSQTAADTEGPIPLEDSDELRSPIDLPAPLERLRIQRSWADTMKEHSTPEPASLAGPIRPLQKQLDYDVHRFRPGETELFDQLARSEAGVISPMLFYLAITVRAHHRVFKQRSSVPPQYLIPVAVDLRRGTDQNPTFRNHVSFLWFEVEPAKLDDRQEVINTLKDQKRSQIQNGFPRKMAIAMENNRFLPTQITRRMMRSQTGGELCSFFFAYTGELFCDIPELCGGEILDGFPTAGVPPSPGSSFVWSLVHGQLNLTHLYQQGVVPPDERDLMLDQIHEELPESGMSSTR